MMPIKINNRVTPQTTRAMKCNTDSKLTAFRWPFRSEDNLYRNKRRNKRKFIKMLVMILQIRVSNKKI